MTWSPLDCHAHTTWSDGQLDMDALIETVGARGVRPSIADHVSRDVVGAVDSLQRLDGYVRALCARQAGRSAEFCWHDGLWREIPRETDHFFTHTIGSLHAVWLADGTLQRIFTRTWSETLAPHAYLDAHVENLERLTSEMPVDIVAHPTLVPIPLRKLPVDELWTESHEARVADAFRSSGAVFEVSSRYRPHERLVRRLVDAGVRLSLGSDGHSAEQVGDVEFSLALTRSLGVDDQALYDPAVHGRRAR